MERKLVVGFWSVVALFVVGVVGVFYWLWGLNVLHWFTASWRESAGFWIPTLAGIVLGVAMIFFPLSKDDYDEPRLWPVFTPMVLGLLAGLFVAIFVSPYMLARGYYDASAKTVKTALAPSYDERAPYEVATVTASKNLMDITGNSQTTKSLSDQGKSGEWNTLITARGMFKGYEAIQSLSLPMYGSAQNSNVKFCKFSESASLRDRGAMPNDNLSRAIYEKVPLDVDYAEGDMYGYCNADKEPVVVVPLKQIQGFMFPTWHPYGVATYNGKTGALDILTTADAVKAIPGPTYPLSLAESQRESLVASGTQWQMMVEHSSGYEVSNSNNEVNLRRSDGSGNDYVTSLVPRGSSTSIVAVSQVAAEMTNPGQYNQLVVNALPSEDVRPANSTLTDNLKTLYSNMPDMANNTVGVFEITNGKDGGWVASIGREQSVNYRAYISPSGTDIKLYDRDGNLIAQGAASRSGSNGSNTGSGSGSSVSMVPTDLSKLSTDQLNQLGKAVMDELAKRSK